MVYRACIPRKPLSDFVEKFWFYEGYAPRGSVEGLLPDGSMNLIVNLGGDEGPKLFDPARKGRAEGLDGCVVTGTHSGFAIVDTAGLATSMGVHFKPGGAFPFLGFSAAELRDAHAPLESTGVDRLLGCGDRTRGGIRAQRNRHDLLRWRSGESIYAPRIAALGPAARASRPP